MLSGTVPGTVPDNTTFLKVKICRSGLTNKKGNISIREEKNGKMSKGISDDATDDYEYDYEERGDDRERPVPLSIQKEGIHICYNLLLFIFFIHIIILIVISIISWKTEWTISFPRGLR